jgi:DNA repair exonuclease SbcCD ATPase subunit
MSETVLRILLGELKTVRILCKGHSGRSCKGVVELSVEAMAELYKDQKCPLCGADIPNTSTNHLEQLGKALVALRDFKTFDVEFVIPEKPAAKP